MPNFAQAGLVGVLRAAQVGHKGIGAQGRVFLQHILRHLFCVLHLRDGLGVHKAGYLHGGAPGVHQAVDDFFFQLGGNELFDALKAVARAHLHQLYMGWVGNAHQAKSLLL
mgnify:CR=1 FL=1